MVKGKYKKTKEHIEKIRNNALKQWATPESRNRLIISLNKSHNIKSFKEKMKLKTKLLWQDPLYRNKISKKIKNTCNTEKYKKEISDKVKKRWADPNIKKRMIAGMLRSSKKYNYSKMSRKNIINQWSNPNSKLNSMYVKEKLRNKAKAQWANPIIRERCIIAIRKGKQKPENIKRFKEIMNTPEYKEKRKLIRLHQVFPKKDSKIEKLLQEELIKNGIIFEKHKPIIGQPDIFIEPNICIFVDGEYVHGDPRKYKESDLLMGGKLVKDKWQYDGKINNMLITQNYKVLRFWENEIYNNMETIINTIKNAMIINIS